MIQIRSVVCGFWLALLAVPGVVSVAVAETVQVYTDYTVSLIGLPVAYLKFVTEVNGKSYSISGDLRTSALTDIVSKTRGSASASGKLGDNRWLASDFSVAYSSGSEARKIKVKFRNGNVRSSTNTPKRPRTAADWVPLSDADLRSVLDPLSGLVFPVGASVCPRSVPIFDGQSRITLHLSPKGVRPFSTNGFKGDAIVCAVRFEPKSGYRKGSSAIQYLRKLKTMEVWFAKHATGGFYAPVYAKVPTKVGQVVVAATRFGG